jgi:hypothetical protein
MRVDELKNHLIVFAVIVIPGAAVSMCRDGGTPSGICFLLWLLLSSLIMTLGFRVAYKRKRENGPPGSFWRDWGFAAIILPSLVLLALVAAIVGTAIEQHDFPSVASIVEIIALAALVTAQHKYRARTALKWLLRCCAVAVVFVWFFFR